jgi:hypothetical protein
MLLITCMGIFLMTERDVSTSQAQNSNVPAPTPAEHVNTGVAEVEKDILLTTYVDRLAPLNFTDEAKSTLVFEVKQFAQDVCSVTKMRRRADRNAEKVLRNHVIDSASFLRNKRENLLDAVADWSKWIGFTFLGFTVQQWIHVQNEKPIASGSVEWLAIDTVVAAGLIVVGFMIDKPWRDFSGRFRGK